MAAERQKMIVIPIDGSENSMRSLDYANLIFGPKHNLKITLFHVLPSLPAVLIQESRKDARTEEQLHNLKKKNIDLAERLLTNAKSKLVKMGFDEQTIVTAFQKQRVGIARDICNWAEDNRADAVIISSRGRSRFEAFFTGEIANKVLEYVKTCPVWMVKGFVIVVFGGLGNPTGAIYAAFILGIAEAVATLYLGALWVWPVWAIIFLVVLLLRPQGLSAGRTL